VAVGGQMDKEMLKKVENDAAAFARTLATSVDGMRSGWRRPCGRRVRHGARGSQLKVIDPDRRQPTRPAREDRRASRENEARRHDPRDENAPVKVIDIRFRDRFLALITDPNIAYILMMVGMLGIFFELSNPGVVLPGVIGASP